MSEPLPSTFESRGILVNFRHKLLQNIRLRIPDSPSVRLRDLEALIQNYAGTSNKHFMILPWIHVPNMATPGRRDQALYDAICQYENLNQLDPLTLRGIINEIDRHDEEDAEAKARATEEVEAAKIDRFTTYISFLAQLTRECGVHFGDRFMSEVDTPTLMMVLEDRTGEAKRLAGFDGKTLTGKVYNYLSKLIGIDNAEITRRIEGLADIVTPFGAINLELEGKREGYLSRAHERLKQFRWQVEDHERCSAEEVANNCLLIAFAVKQYVDYIEEKRRDIEQKFSLFRLMVQNYDESIEFIRKVRRQVSFALDGWSQLIDVWDQAWAVKDQEDGRREVDKAVFFILQFLPLMPSAELNEGSENKQIWKRYQFFKAKPIPQMYSWFDEKPDTELMERIENAKAQRALQGRSIGDGTASKVWKR